MTHTTFCKTLIVALALGVAGTAQAAGESDVLAEVNGTPITRTMLQQYAAQRGMNPGQLRDPQRRSLLEELISRELIYQAGLEAGIDEQPEVRQAIHNQRVNIIASATLDAKTDVNNISEEDLRAEYDAKVGAGGESEYKARHILLDSEDEASAVIEELDGGADFTTLAREKSTGPSGKDGGDLGWFSANQMVEPFSEAVARLDKGSYTGTPVKTQFGWHVILLEDTRDLAPPEFESVREQLLNNMRGERIQAYLETLREGAEIEIKQP